MKKVFTILAALVLGLNVVIFAPNVAAARGHAHYSYQGGHYAGGHGSSHRGGHYRNARTGNHYTHHH